MRNVTWTVHLFAVVTTGIPVAAAYVAFRQDSWFGMLLCGGVAAIVAGVWVLIYDG